MSPRGVYYRVKTSSYLPSSGVQEAYRVSTISSGDVAWIDYDLSANWADTSAFTNISTKTLPILSSSTSLRTRMYGNPSSYPTAIKDRLAAGLPLIGLEPVLVSDD